MPLVIRTVIAKVFVEGYEIGPTIANTIFLLITPRRRVPDIKAYIQNTKLNIFHILV